MDWAGKLLGAFGLKMPGAKDDKEVQQEDQLKTIERQANSPGLAKGVTSWLDRTEKRGNNIAPDSAFKAAA